MKRQKAKAIFRNIEKQLKKGIIPKNLSKRLLLNAIKNHLTYEEGNRVLQNLDDETFEFIISTPIVNSYNELAKEVELYSENNLDKEIIWICRFLEDYNEEIISFLNLEKEYDRLLLHGKYSEAKEIIDRIDKEVSLSMWSIQQNLLLAELEKGFQANKNFLTSILSNTNSVLVNFITSYTSIRIEKNISRNQYESLIDQYISLLKNEDLNDYVFYKVDFFRTFTYPNVALILSIESQLSIIDRYKSFISVSQILCSRRNLSTKVEATLRNCIDNLYNSIKDPDLKILNTLLSGKTEIDSSDQDFIKIVDLYTDGSYPEVIEQSREYLKSHPKSFPSILFYCKSLANLNLEHANFNVSENLIDTICSLCFEILSKKADMNLEKFFELIKLADSLGNHPLGVGIISFLSFELPYRFEHLEGIDLHKFFLLNSRAFNPALYQYIKKDELNFFLNTLEKNSEKGSTLTLINKIEKNKHSLTNDLSSYTLRELKYIAAVLRSNNKSDEAIKVLDYVFSIKDFSEAYQGINIYLDFLVERFRCLVNLKRFSEALELATDHLIKNKNYLERLYDPEFISILIETNDSLLQSNICSAIYLKYYEQNVNSYDIYVAYDNFLCSNDCEVPSQFINKLMNVTERDIAFLDLVCRHEILHSSPFFADQEELDLARIEICNFLSKHVKPSLQIQNEISDLFRKILVRKGIKQIDYSKIYVDVKGLKSTLNKELKESFIRNIEIASLPLDQLNKIVDSVGSILVYYLDKEIEEESASDDEVVNGLKLTSYNRFLHFSEAFLKVRDSFISSKDHGLDTYLSMRIRHGTLLGQIRSVFETHNLITVISETQDEYLSNLYWIDKFPNLHENEKEVLDNAFKLFSKSIDNIAAKLKSQTIQIKTENSNSSGLFDYSYSQDQLLSLFTAKFGSIKDFDIFLEEVINELWNKTETCLKRVRSYLNNEFNDIIENVFTQLEITINSIDSIKHSYQLEFKELISVIRNCRTAITVEIQKISEWFNRSNKKIIDEFDFSILLESCINTLQSINPLFKEINIQIYNNFEEKFDGDLFPYFTDIFFYLLHNAIIHSKLDSNDLNIEIHIDYLGSDTLKITIVNNVWNNAEYLNQIEQRLNNTKKTLKDVRTYEHINKEGGTGFPKIKKTLSQDLNRKNYKIEMNLNKRDQGEVTFETLIEFELNNLTILPNSENITNRR